MVVFSMRNLNPSTEEGAGLQKDIQFNMLDTIKWPLSKLVDTAAASVTIQ
jgi:hypothetical protein